MKLKTVTLITIFGLSASLIIRILQYRLGAILWSPEIALSFLGTICLYGSLLFLLVYLYRRS